ncbi:hypothetical protein DL98DRAFT_539211 [Cadophora sp. DSE1049]|nr:hypothetical protein DL98DRAFT_539211 [Cadophora sp. DSE1049]
MALSMTKMQQDLSDAEETIECLRELLSDIDDQNSKLVFELKRNSIELKLALTASAGAKSNVSILSKTVDDLIAHAKQQTTRGLELENQASNCVKLRSALEEIDRPKATHFRVVAERDWYQAKTQRCLEVLGAVESSRSEESAAST